MKRTIWIAALVTVATSLSARTEEAALAAKIWSLFETHCGKFAEADDAQGMAAAFKPNKVEIGVTPDGAILTGHAAIDDSGIGDRSYVLFNFFVMRLEAGAMRTCTLTVHDRNGAKLGGVPAEAEANAKTLIGDGFVVSGGPMATAKGLEGIAVLLTTPDFPPARSILAVGGESVANLTLSTMTLEKPE